MFETLVKQGEVLETKTRRAAQDTAAAARGAAKAKVSEVSRGVGGTWDKLEQVFEDRVARALSKLGVHTQSDVDRPGTDRCTVRSGERTHQGRGNAITATSRARIRAQAGEENVAHRVQGSKRCSEVI